MATVVDSDRTSLKDSGLRARDTNQLGVKDGEKMDDKGPVQVSRHDPSMSSLSLTNGKYTSTSSQHRKFESYHINLISIGGTVGTALFVYMGSGLTQGGPANLLLGYAWWTSVIWAVAECQIETVTQWPTDAAFSRFAGRYIDPAAGFAVGWNFFLSQVALVVFEVVAFGLVIGYWATASVVPDAGYISIVIVAYLCLNVWNAKFFGNAEFTFALGKVILIMSLLIFTFLAMVGANPQKDAFGFQYWKNPGAMTTPYPKHTPRSFALFEGFLACVINACFTIAGPDYLSMVAGEARNPRQVMPKAFKRTIYRLCFFYIGSALAIGILVPFNDPNLLGAISAGAPGGARSPYVIGMNRLNVPVFPHIVNALILSSVFSAGNAYMFCASRTLAQMARDGHAPSVLARRNRHGTPYFSVLVCIAISLLSFCQVSSSAQVVITWLTGLVGSAQLVNWCVMSFTWIRWNAGLKAQGISRDTLFVRSRFQPYAAWYALICSIFVLLMQGYGVFLKGAWDISYFLFSYAMPIIFFVLFVGFKVIRRTTWYKSDRVDVTSYVDDPEFDSSTYADVLDENRGKIGTFNKKLLKTLF